MSGNDSNYGYKFLVAGDSISKGIVFDEDKSKYVVLKNNYIALLRDRLNGTVRNTARFGDTLIKGITKLKAAVSKDVPDIVLLEYGGNDCDFNWDEISNNPDGDYQPKTDFYTFGDKLKGAVNFLKNNDILPVLMTLPPLDADRYLKWISKNSVLAENNILKWLGSVTKIYWWQEKYSSAVIRIAEETNTKCIDIRGAFLNHPDFTKLLCLDGIHPNESGHKLIADKIITYIRSNTDNICLLNKNTVGTFE